MTDTVVHPPDTHKPPLSPRLVISAVTLITGGVGLIYEYLLATTASYLLGSSVEQFSVTIGLMMLMMGIGAWMQKKLPDTWVLGALIGIELFLCLLGGFAPIANLWSFANVEDHYALVQYGFVTGIGLAIGVEIPLAARLNELFERRLKVNLARIMSFDYIGACVGAFLWLWLLNRMTPLTSMSFYTAGGNLAVAVLCFGYFWRKGMIRTRRHRIIGLVAIVMTAITLVLGATNAGSWTMKSNQDLYQDPVAYSLNTKYQQLVITKRTNPLDIRLYLNGNLQYSSVDEDIYHELLVQPAMNVGPHGRVLVLGGGDGVALREIEKYKDVQSITLVDLDPGMIHWARTNPLLTLVNHNSFRDARVSTKIGGVHDTGATTPVAMRTDRKIKLPDGNYAYATRQVASVHVYTVDAFQFVRAAQPGTYDTVIIDLPDPNTVELAKLYSQQFYHMVRSVMAPNGVMVVQAGSPFHAREAYVCTLNTIRTAGFRVLPYHANVPSFGDWGWVLAWKNPHTNPLAVVHQKLAGLKTWPVPTRYLVNGASFTSTLPFGKGWLDPAGITPSTIMNPTILNYYVNQGWKIE